jgi:Domain of unknown function (DUF4124)
MQKLLTILAALAVLGSAEAGEVFLSKDAQGRPIYTDRPESLPAQKVNIATKQTDTVEVQKRYDSEMKTYQAEDQQQSDADAKKADAKKAQQMTAEDKAKRCQDARTRYEAVMSAQRLYEPGETEGERRYLDSSEIDAAREYAKKVMDEFCTGP